MYTCIRMLYIWLYIYDTYKYTTQVLHSIYTHIYTHVQSKHIPLFCWNLPFFFFSASPYSPLVQWKSLTFTTSELPGVYSKYLFTTFCSDPFRIFPCPEIQEHIYKIQESKSPSKSQNSTFLTQSKSKPFQLHFLFVLDHIPFLITLSVLTVLTIFYFVFPMLILYNPHFLYILTRGPS